MPVPGSPEWHERVEKLLAEEAKQPLGWWYLSFAEPGKFLGAAFIQARGMTLAIRRAHSLGINPGGEVAAWLIPPEEAHKIPRDQKHRLLAKEELERTA